MENFSSLGLPQPLMQALDRLQFQTPTEIQAQAIPPAMEGRDILGSAETGTGKTLAFGIPLLSRLMSSPRGAGLIVTPTRELAAQVIKALQDILGKSSPIKTALLIGGEAMPQQLRQLRARPRLIVGTPGRINDHLTRGSLMLHDASFLVLDETDRMLDMGFSIQIEQIMKYLPKQRQTLLFSATLPDDIIKMANGLLHNPVRVEVGSTTKPSENIKQEVVYVPQEQKYDRLLAELEQRSGSVIIFMKTKFSAEKMAIRLSKDGHSADALHGDLRHSRRERVIKAFRNQKHRILVATDIAARGLDVPHIEHVVNFDLPQVPEDYIHRIGRTARAGAEGSAICFVSPADKGKWYAIQCLIDPEAAVNMPRDKKSKGSKGKKKFANKGSGKSSGKAFGRDAGDGARDSKGKKSFGRKPTGKKPFGKKTDSWKDQDERKSFDGERKRRDDRDFRQGDSRDQEKNYNGYKGDRKSDQPRRDEWQGKKKSQGRKSFDDKPSGKKSFGYKSSEGRSEDRAFSDKPGKSFGKSFGKKFSKGPSADGKSFGKSGSKAGDKPRGKSDGKSFGKPSGKFAQKPGGKPGSRPQGSKPRPTNNRSKRPAARHAA